MAFNLSTLSSDARSEILLDFVKGRATEAQAAAIRLAMESDDAIAEEVAYYQGLSNALAEPEKNHAGDELGWARLEKAIDAERTPVAANDNTRFWKYAAAAFALVAAFQTTLLVQSGDMSEEPVYVTASDSDVDAFALTLAFKSDATLDQITQLLQTVDGELTEGPSALGLYVVSFESDQQRATALNALQNAPDLVESVSRK